MNRRGFLASILAAGVAPAIAGSGVLMPVRPVLWTPQTEIIITGSGGDGPDMFVDAYKRGDGPWIKWDPPIRLAPGGILLLEGREIIRNGHNPHLWRSDVPQRFTSEK